MRSCPRSCSLPWRCHAVRPYQPFASTLAIPLSNLCLPRTRKRKVLLDVVLAFNRKIHQRPAFPGWKLMATSMAVGPGGLPPGEKFRWSASPLAGSPFDGLPGAAQAAEQADPQPNGRRRGAQSATFRFQRLFFQLKCLKKQLLATRSPSERCPFSPNLFG